MVTGSLLTLSQAAQAAGDPTIFGQSVSANTGTTLSAATGLDLPRGLAFDGAGDLYIANVTNTVKVLPQASGTLFGQSVSANTSATLNEATSLSGATGAAFDAAGDLFIANDDNGTVTVVPQASGTLFGQSVTANTSTVLSVEGQPNGIAFDAAGDLFIANATNTVTVLPQASGTLFGQSVSANTAATLTAATGLSNASGIAFDAAGDLFIANAGSNSVTVVPASTGTLFGQSVSANTASTLSAATGLSEPRGLAFDAAGDLFITNQSNNTVTVVPASTGTVFGQSVSANTATTLSAATGLDAPWLDTFDAAGDLFIADEGSNSVTVVAAQRPAVSLYVVSGGAGTGDCSSPANACASIQTAINTAEGGSYNGDDVTINVGAGTYTEDDTINASSLNSLTIAGAGASSTAVNGDQNGTVFTVNSGTVTISGLTITNGGGQNAGYGGGIDNNGTLTVTDSTVSDNNSLYFGGGIWNTGTLTVTGSTLSGNTTAAFGGGIDNNGGTLTVTDSTLSGNSAGDQAGGIKTDSGTVTVTNSTLSGNSATLAGSLGGGIESYQSSTTVLDSTLSGNGAASGGNIQYQSGTLYLGATILADSTSGNDCAGGGITDEGYNIADDASCGFTATGSVNSSPTLDADLGPLQNNGGPTDTMALLPGSPAIDQVTSGSGLCPATDQRGAPRTAPCDIGAYDTDWGPAVEIDISGTQDFGGSATLSYTTNAPGGIVSGTLTCATVDNGTPISSALAVGSYTVDGSSCSGLTSSDQADHAIFPSSYTGVANGFAVPDITSVSFGGSVASPTVTVVGVGFGTPANLGTAQSSCGTGSDYAANLFLTDTTKTWSAGQGSDCIGLIVNSYSDTDIVLTFGSQYGTGGDVLTGGDSYTMNVLGSTFSGTDTYYPYPVVSAVSPDTGFTTGTTPVTITGSGFTGATAVDFGGVAATNVMVVNDTTITADSPSGSAGPPMDVTVTGPGGVSVSSPADQYTYTVDQTIPQTVTCTTSCPTNTLTSPLNQTVVSVAATVAPPANATTSLTVNTDTLNCGASKTKNYDYTAAVSTLSAQGFARKAALTVTETVGNEPSTAGVQVCFGTGPNPTTGKFLKQCKASMKAPCLKSLTESGGSVLATFLAPATDPRFWTGNAAADLSSFSPAKAAPGATVTIKGTNLNGVVAVVIGGAKATISTASTAAKLVVTVPEKATVGAAFITVTSASGQAVSVKKFTVT